MKYCNALRLAVLFLITASVSFAQNAGSPTLVLQGGTLIDGTGAAPRENGTIVVRGDKILSVLPNRIQPLPEGVRSVDARGKYVLPGLVDGHTHYAGYAAQLYLHYGITSVVDTGNTNPWILVQKDANRRGLLAGPRIYSVGAMIDNPPEIFGDSTILVETEEAARAAVRRQAAEGVDAIKVYKQLRPDLMRAVIEEAHLNGIPVTGHVAISARDAIMMGIDSFEHATGIPIATMTDREKLREIEEKRYTDIHYLVDHLTVPESFYYMQPELYGDLIKLFVEKGISVTPTLVCYWLGGHRFSEQYEQEDRALLADPAYAFVPELDRRWIMEAYRYFGQVKSTARYQQAYKNLQLFLKQLSEAGGKIVAGSDATPYEMHGINLHREIELLVDSGLTPMKALLAATRYAAEKFRAWDEVGSVEPGKYADFLILDANPLEDIRNTQKIHMVIQGGRILDTRLDPTRMDEIPHPPSPEGSAAKQEILLFGRTLSP